MPGLSLVSQRLPGAHRVVGAVRSISGWLWTDELDASFCSSSFCPSGVQSGLVLRLNI